MEGKPPPKNIPHICCDFNACGFSGETGDNCYYVLHKETLIELNHVEEINVFIYDDDIADDGFHEIFGYIAKLERTPFGYKSKWRARPNVTTWYRGPCPW